MISSPIHQFNGIDRRSNSERAVFRALVPKLLALCLLASSGSALAQTFQDDFNDGNDAGWSHLDLSAVGDPATFSFPADGAGGKAYRLQEPPPAEALGGAAGPARVFSYRADTYTRFSYSVDIINWDTTIDQAWGFLARATSIGLGSTDGYVMNYNVANGNLQINEITGEIPTTIAESNLPLNPQTAKYRFVFNGYGDNLVGRLFALPDVVNPLASVIANDPAHPTGQAGLFAFDRNDFATYTNVDVTFDNYSASVPAAGSLPATVVMLVPKPKEVVRALPVTISAAILNQETDVNTDSIVLSVDGQVVPKANLTLDLQVLAPGNPNPFPGATISFPLPTPTTAAGFTATHTNRLTFKDSAGVSQTNEWTYTYASLSTANAVAHGAGKDPGFSVRLVEASQSGPALANSLARAEVQLAANPPAGWAVFTTNAVADAINYTIKNTNDANYTPDGYFGNEANLPGIDPVDQPNPVDFAMEIFSYLDLPAGWQTFGVRCDDGFQLRSGASFTDTNALVLGQQISGTYDGTFDFYVPQAGVYPFRMVWFQRGGGAHVELFSVDRTTGARTLINDPSGTIKAYRNLAVPNIVLESAPTLTQGGFVPESSAVIDTTARKVTVAPNGSQRYYRLRSANALTIATVQIVNGNIVLTY